MSTSNDRIRRELGFDLIKAAQKAAAKPHPAPQPQGARKGETVDVRTKR